MKPIKIPNRVHYFYENILRNDLLLKLDCTNIMEVPQLNRAIVLANPVSPNNNKNASRLALEILSGQKASSVVIPSSAGLYVQNSNRFAPKTAASRGPSISSSLRLKKARSESSLRGPKAQRLAPNGASFSFCSLRSSSMYHFLEKFLSSSPFGPISRVAPNARSAHESKIQIQGQEIKFTLNNRTLRAFGPEIPNHFEFFEHIPTVQVKLISSTKNKNATLLLWTGLQQKEI